MAFLGKGRKQDLIILARELGLSASEENTILQLKKEITSSENYEEELVKNMLITIIEDRQEMSNKLISEQNAKEKAEELERINQEKIIELERLLKEKEKDQAYELERLRLQVEAQKAVERNPFTEVEPCKPKYELKSLLPVFKPEDDISLFLNLFERQAKFLKIEENQWVTHLVGVLPGEIVKLIAREPNEKTEDYPYIKDLLLKRFKLSAEKFRQLFSSQRKSPGSTWTDFYFELRNYFENWLAELKIDTYDKLQDLIIADQIKRKCPPDYKDHYLDQWCEWNDPICLADKLDSYEEIRNSKSENVNYEPGKKDFVKYKTNYDFKHYEYSSNQHKYSGNRNINKSEDRSISCYGCGKTGFIKAKCPSCSPISRVDSAQVSSLKFQTCSLEDSQTTQIKIKINGMFGLACADTGASHTVAGETLYNLLRDQGVEFYKMNLNVTLADGLQKITEVFKTEIDVELEGRHIPTTLFVLPSAKNNRTLLGTDFLSKAGIILDIPNNRWYFNCNPREKFNFQKDNFVPPCNFVENTAEIFVPPCKTVEVVADINSCVMKENEGHHEHLSSEERSQFEKIVDIFQPGEEATPKVNGMLLNGRKEFVGKFIPRKEREKLLGEKARPFLNVYIKNFGDDLDDEKLRELFEKYGKITSAKVMSNKIGKSKGFGFVSFKDPENAEKAVEDLNGKELNGKTLYVGRAQRKYERAAELKRCFELMKIERMSRYQGVNLYVKNLDDAIDDERLCKEFAPYGTITSAKVMTDSNGRSKGFGFVCFSSPEAATKAVTEMNGRIVVSKSLYVDVAHRKEDRIEEKQYNVGDKVLVTLHPKSQSKSSKTAKFMPRRDGPYTIMSQRSPTSYTIATLNNPFSPIGNYHTSCLSPYQSSSEISPMTAIRGRGRPKKEATYDDGRTDLPRRSPRFQPATRGRNVAG